MIAKNNREVKIQKWLGNHQQHFALKHLTIGVASVLVGISITGASVLADSNQPVTTGPTTSSQTASVASPTPQNQSTVKLNNATAIPDSKEKNGVANLQSSLQTKTGNQASDQQQAPAAKEITPVADVHQWTTTTPDENGSVTLTNYQGPVTGQTIVIPNAVDFRNAGQQDVKQIIITPELAGTLKNATTLVTSQTSDEKSIKAADGSWSGAFQGGKLENIDLTGLNISGVTDVSSMFANNEQLKEITGLQTWDTSNVRNFNNLFNGDRSLTGTVDISNWNLASLDAVGEQENRADTHVHGAGMDGMFQGTQVTAIKAANWDFTANQLVVDRFPDDYSVAFGLRVAPFTGLAHLQTLDISGWKLPTVTDPKNASLSLTYLAMNCPELTTVDLSGWQGNSLGRMTAAFENDSNLATINGIEDFNASNVWDLSDAFQGTGLTNVDLHKWDVRNVHFFTQMLKDTKKLQTINLSGWKLYDLTPWHYPTRNFSFDNLKTMLEGTGATSIDTSNWDFGNNNADVHGLFSSLTNLTTVDVSGWNSPEITNMADLFAYDPKLAMIKGLADLDTDKVTNMSGVFQHDLALTSVDGIQNWNTNNVTTMAGMFNFMTDFYGNPTPCALTSIPDLSSWKTGQVQDMTNMFSGLDNPGLTTINGITDWDTSNVTKTNQMFAKSTSLKNLDLTKWRMDNVITTNSMFYGADHLTTVGNLTNWNLANDTDTAWMFRQTTSLKQIGDRTTPWKWALSTKNTNAGGMFSQSGVEYVDARDWDLSHSNASQLFFNSAVQFVDGRNMKLGNANTTGMFAALKKPAVIDLRGTKGNFKMDAFDGLGKFINANSEYSQPLVVLSDDPAVRALNDAKYAYTKTSQQTFTGRNDSNYLSFFWSATDGNKPTLIGTYSIDADDQHPGMFVFEDPDSVWSAFRQATSKDKITKLLGKQATKWNYVADLDPATKSLKVGPQTSLPELVSYATELTLKGAPATFTDIKKVNETIHYRFADGTTAKPDVVKTVTLSRTGSKDAMTGEITWGAWSTGVFPDVESPELVGYTADQTVVAGSPATNNREVTVTYYKNAPTTVTGTKKVTETIHYKFADGTKAYPDKTQTVTLIRTGSKDAATGDITWGIWSTASFSAVLSPELAGYTADQTIVAETLATDDLDITVTYVKNKEVEANALEQSKPATPTMGRDSKSQILRKNDLANGVVTKSAPQKSNAKLPQTGNDDESLGVLGLAIVGLTSLLGFESDQKKHPY